MRRGRGLLVLPVLMAAIAAAVPSVASAEATPPLPEIVKPALPPGTITKTYQVPLSIKPGQNLNLYEYIKANQRPSEAGWIVGFRPDLKLADGTTPPVDQIHLHHLVMLLNSDIIVASGEEKTQVTLPTGFGYPYKPTDRLMLNHMIHNFPANPENVVFEYTVDFLPASAPAAAATAERPAAARSSAASLSSAAAPERANTPKSTGTASKTVASSGLISAESPGFPCQAASSRAAATSAAATA